MKACYRSMLVHAADALLYCHPCFPSEQAMIDDAEAQMQTEGQARAALEEELAAAQSSRGAMDQLTEQARSGVCRMPEA